MAVNSPCLVIWTAIITSRMNAHQLTDQQKLNISDPSFSELCVRTHNYHRSRVSPTARDMMYMTWDETLAKVAQDWASKCIFSHNPSLQISYKLHPSFRAVGENIWIGSTASFSVENAIQNWAEELKYYSTPTKQINVFQTNQSVAITLRVIWGSEPVYTYDPKAENTPGWGANPSQGSLIDGVRESPKEPDSE